MPVPSCSWSYDSWNYNYMCNQCPSPLTLWVRVPFLARCTRLQHYVIKFVIDLRQVRCILCIHQFPPPIKLIATIYWNIVESGVKHHFHHHLETCQSHQHWYITFIDYATLWVVHVLLPVQLHWIMKDHSENKPYGSMELPGLNISLLIFSLTNSRVLRISIFTKILIYFRYILKIVLVLMFVYMY